MITIEHSFGADLDWIESYATQFRGKIDGNFIISSDDISSGTLYFLDCGNDTVVFYGNVEYFVDISFVQKNFKDDFIGFYYEMSENKTFDTQNLFNVGNFGYNLLIIDGALAANHVVKAGTKTVLFCVFIKKIKIRSFAQKNPEFLSNVDKISDPENNTFIKFDRISPKSQIILQDLIKMPVSGSVFNLALISAAHLLVSDYLIQMLSNTIVVEKVNQNDFVSIIESQFFLIENIHAPFPSIKYMAQKANMSESKFKKLFTKITGTTPNNFFMNHKLVKAKELLIEKKHTISEVAEELSFNDYSYFIFRFKKQFGVSPLTFIKRI